MKILFYGDSITDVGRNRDGEHPAFKMGMGYPNLIAAELAYEDPNGYEFFNRGISGNRIVDLYARIKMDVWNLKPDVLSILIGVNDVWHEIEYENGVELDRWEKIYRTMLTETLERLPNLKIILCEPFVLKGEATEGEGRWEKFQGVREYAKVVEKIAKAYGLPFVALQDKFDAAAEKNGAANYLYDGVHPAAAGAKLIANEWLKAFEQIKK